VFRKAKFKKEGKKSPMPSEGNFPSLDIPCSANGMPKGKKEVHWKLNYSMAIHRYALIHRGNKETRYYRLQKTVRDG